MNKLQKAKFQYKVPASNNYKKMIVHPDIEAVIICTLSGFYLEPAVMPIKTGKHVLIETFGSDIGSR